MNPLRSADDTKFQSQSRVQRHHHDGDKGEKHAELASINKLTTMDPAAIGITNHGKSSAFNTSPRHHQYGETGHGKQHQLARPGEHPLSVEPEVHDGKRK